MTLNAYEKRKAERVRKYVHRNVERQASILAEADSKMRKYEEAYLQYHGRSCKVSFVSGWYTVHNRKVRAERLDEMTAKIQALLHEKELRNENP